MNTIIKTLYLYLVSFVALMMVVISMADVLNITLRTFIFKKADRPFGYYPQPVCDTTNTSSTPGFDKYNQPCVSKEEQERHRKEQEKIELENSSAQRQRDLVRDISFAIVGVPLFAYHWSLIRRKEEVA